jgi:ribosomal protein S18 acetylase RimI-like enzyme
MTILNAAGITYRAATEADFDAVARLWLESWQSTGLAITRFATEEGNRKRIALEVANGWKITVALADQRIVGFLAIKPAASLLDQLFVASDMKDKGIGKALLATAKAEMPNGFTLHTAAENSAARAFYERFGLVRVRTETHPTLGNTVAIYRWP